MRFMRLLFYICIGASAGTFFGVIRGSYVRFRRWNRLTEAQLETYRKFRKNVSRILAVGTFLLLVLGLIWCMYFLILGLCFPEQAEYANNMSELIVAVLTVVSIIFAFYEFLQHKS